MKRTLSTVLAATVNSLLLAASTSGSSTPAPLPSNAVVALLGGENLVRVQRAGILETAISTQALKKDLRFRDLSWEGDTVFIQTTINERWREEKYGEWPQQLKHVGATVVWAQYGKMESLRGPAGLEAFTHAYSECLKQWQSVTDDITLISPIAFESTDSSLQPDLPARNQDLAAYVDAIRTLADQHSAQFVDLFQPSLRANAQGKRLTANGLHIAPDRQTAWANLFLSSAGYEPSAAQVSTQLRSAVIEKHRLWFEYWRPANWKCLFGDDGERIFGQADGIYPTFREEWRRYPALIEQAETRIQDLLRGITPAEATQITPLLTGWSQARPAQADVQQALNDFELPEGSTVNLFASEAEGLVNPLAMRWDSAGSLYVACTIAYPQHEPGEVPDDFIIKLRDTDHDGVVDESTRFAGGLNIPTGIEIAPNGIYVGQGTQLLLLRDTDGDHRADVREVVLNGFGNGDTHQTSNSFAWSPGGQLYWCQGDGVESRVETPWGISRLFQAGVFRWRPDRNQLEGLLDDFMGPGNPWGIAFDDWGQPIVIDGAGGVTHLGPALLPSPYRLRLPTIGRPGGYCGIDVIGTPHWPTDMQGDFIIGDYKPNAVSRFALRKDGASYNVMWKDPIITSRDEFFRPVDVKVGPDGAIYVCDWFNTVICHQDDSYRHTARDKGHGRIWRVARTQSHGDTPTASSLTVHSVADLIKNLGSRDRWLREQSKRELLKRDRILVTNALDHWTRVVMISKSPDREFRLLQALTMYETLESPKSTLLQHCLRSPDARVRAYAARTIGRWHDRLSEPLARVESVIHDPDPQVRMEAILACGNIPFADSVRIAAQALQHPTDRWIDYAFTQTVRFLEPHWIPALRAGSLNFADRGQDLIHIVRAARSRNLANTVRPLATDTTLPPEARSAAQLVLATAGKPSDVLTLLDPSAFKSSTGYAAKAHTRILNGLLQADPPGTGTEVSERITSLIKGTDQEVQSAAIALAAQWKLETLGPKLAGIAQDADQTLALRQAAIAALPHTWKQAELALTTLSSSPATPALQQAALTALAEINPSRAATVATQQFAEGTDFKFSAALLRSFLTQAGGGQALARAIEEIDLHERRARELLDELVVLGYSDPGLTETLRERAGFTSEIPDYSETFISQLAREAQESGNPHAGERVFRSAAANCYSCHAIAGAGANLGPDLSNTGTGIPIRRLIEEVVWPTRQVKEGYALTQVTDHQGAIYQGYERKERDQGRKELILDEFGTQKRLRIPREQIDSVSEIGSIMPPTAVSLLTRPQLRDLIAFLTELGAPGPFSTRNRDYLRSWEVAPAEGDPTQAEWLPIQARVSGHLDRTDLQTAVGTGVERAWIRTTVDLDGNDEESLRLNNDETVTAWVNGLATDTDRNRISIKPGTHELRLEIDLANRGAFPISVRW